MRFNGWQRIGIIASGCWLLAGGLWVSVTDVKLRTVGLTDTLLSCEERPGAIWDACEAEFHRNWHAAMEGHWVSSAFATVAAVLFVWVMAYIIKWLVAWVARGFHPDSNRSDPSRTIRSSEYPDAGAWSLENLRGATVLGAQTLRSLELINGGAAVALLSFYGNAATKAGGAVHLNTLDLRVSLSWFGAGVMASASAAILAYVAQVTVATTVGRSTRWETVEVATRWVAIVAGLVSIGAFGRGLWWAATSFS